MKRNLKQIVSEVLWLALVLVFTIMVEYLLFGNEFLNRQVDLHLHDTYFLIPNIIMFSSIYFIMIFAIYFTKTHFFGLRTKSGSWILLLSGIVLIILSTICVKAVSQFSGRGWTLYPPLSALDHNKTQEFIIDPVWTLLVNIFIFVQVIILILTLYSVSRWKPQA